MKKLLILALLIFGCGVLESLKEGCTDSSACNYDADAGKDDGSCLENDCAGVCGGNAICGCTDDNALNYSIWATYNDGSCEYDTIPPTILNLTLDWLYCNYLDVCTQPLLWLDFSASVYDYGSGVDYVEAWINYTSLGKEYYTYSWTWNPYFEYEGYKTFKVRAYDESGNYSEATKTFYYIPD